MGSAGLTPVEQAVRDLCDLRARATKIEGWRRELRLGRGVESVDDRPVLRRLQMPAAVYGVGWFSAAAERLPEGMEQEFYRFLGDQASDVGRQIREATARLQEVDLP